MTTGTSYVHKLEGRLRIKVPAIKRSAARAEELAAQLWNLKGAKEVYANPTTGNLLVLFDSKVLDHEHIIQTLKDLSYLPSQAAPSPHTSTVAHMVSETLLRTAAEHCFERALLAIL